MLKLLFLSQLLSAQAALIWGPDGAYFHRPLTRAPLHQFYPYKVRVNLEDRKPRMRYGTPGVDSIAITEFIESVPVERRILELESLLTSRSRANLFRSAKSDYQKYLLSTMFIDSRLLRLLIRFGTNHMHRITESKIRSAAEMISHLQKTFPEHDFSYLTPDYVLEWYNMVGLKQWEVYSVSMREPEDLPDDEIVQLQPATWRDHILEPRLERLIQTGYDSFH